jgi:hypothetical protein
MNFDNKNCIISINPKISSNTSIAIAVISTIMDVASSPIVLNQAFAAKTTTTTCSGSNDFSLDLYFRQLGK